MKDNVTIVSGYWKVTSKYSHDKFEKWFDNTLSINCPYVFIGNEESINIVKAIRKDLPTYYINIEISDFYLVLFSPMLFIVSLLWFFIILPLAIWE